MTRKVVIENSADAALGLYAHKIIIKKQNQHCNKVIITYKERGKYVWHSRLCRKKKM
ncbi:MAG: hypothetical protein L6V91_05955 [Bacilli bacterium]|nr:MAG: hypothetical protein L6V91_05955 [Bacilli bacterium]